MRHRKSHRKLGRTASHRKALLASLCTALFRHKKIKTTVTKAKETRMFVEKMITRARRVYGLEDIAKNVHARRMVARTIKDKDVVKELFTEIASKVASRPGGYTRIVKLGRRKGDGAEVALLELVDYEGVVKPGKATKAEKTSKADTAGKETREPKEKKAPKPAAEKKDKSASKAKKAAADAS